MFLGAKFVRHRIRLETRRVDPEPDNHARFNTTHRAARPRLQVEIDVSLAGHSNVGATEISKRQHRAFILEQWAFALASRIGSLTNNFEFNPVNDGTEFEFAPRRPRARFSFTQDFSTRYSGSQVGPDRALP